MISGKDIIHFSLDDYHRSDPHSRYHLCKQFLRHNNRLIWVNSFGMRVPNLRKKGSIKRIPLKLKGYVRPIVRIDENLWVFSPLAVPALKGRTAKFINNLFLLLQMRLMLRLLRIRNPILFVTSPMFPEVIRRISRDLVIYYYSDKYVSYREITRREEIVKLDSATLELADYVFCASMEIYKEASKNNAKTFYLPHAVDFEHFNGILRSKTVKPWDMRDIRKPIVGYFGSLTDSNDIELIKSLAIERPRYSVVLIGHPSGQYAELSSISNIYLLGRKNYSEIPLYGKYFDVCFMAWKMTEWIKNCSPLKTLEYLALSKPVVAFPIKELISRYANVVDIAYGKADFLEKIDYNLRNNSPQKRKARINFAKQQTWEKRFAEMIEIIEKS